MADIFRVMRQRYGVHMRRGYSRVVRTSRFMIYRRKVSARSPFFATGSLPLPLAPSVYSECMALVTSPFGIAKPFLGVVFDVQHSIPSIGVQSPPSPECDVPRYAALGLALLDYCRVWLIHQMCSHPSLLVQSVSCSCWSEHEQQQQQRHSKAPSLNGLGHLRPPPPHTSKNITPMARLTLARAIRVASVAKLCTAAYVYTMHTDPMHGLASSGGGVHTFQFLT